MAAALGELSGRVFWYAFVHLALFIALYLLGNVQEFLDQTQLLLLRLMQLAAIVASGSGVYRLGHGIVRVFTGAAPGAVAAVRHPAGHGVFRRDGAGLHVPVDLVSTLTAERYNS